ncbi:cytosolic phospholipase A2-like isoform X2 [Megalobrama amblycephala]|uniref:cytosolic phospholipase A2-like isoform X2 n=1 Tax=Megalobrama amblycephala TaxID=75352 RepID=UPI002013E310|nr:cytosolic phospholipase A2-like isoform X2 [Megalobrama amblycephala]
MEEKANQTYHLGRMKDKMVTAAFCEAAVIEGWSFDHQHTAATSIPDGFTPEKAVTPEVEKICLEMSASKLQESEVRIKHSLNKNEEEFRIRRRNTVQQCLQKLGIHCSLNDVPNIALLGSGGGQRAMVGLLGSVVQLHKCRTSGLHPLSERSLWINMVHGLLISGSRLVYQTRDCERQDHPETQRP